MINKTMTNHELTIAFLTILAGLGAIHKRLDKLEAEEQLTDDKYDLLFADVLNNERT